MDRAAALRLPSRFVVPPHVSAVILKRVVEFSLLRPSVCRSLEILIQVPGKRRFVGASRMFRACQVGPHLALARPPLPRGEDRGEGFWIVCRRLEYL